MPIANIIKAWTYLRSRPLVWDTITTTVLSTFGKGAGFLIPFFVAVWFGATAETDAFFYAYGLIVFMAVIFSPVVESLMVPFIAEARAKNEDVGAFVGKVLGTTLAILSILSAAFLFFIKPLLPLISRFSPEGIDLIFVILLESIPLALLLVWTSVLSGTLNAYKIFGVPAISPAFRAIATLSFIFLFKDSMGVHSIAWGYVVGEAVRLAILFVILGRLKSTLRLKLSLGWDKKFTGFLKTSSYQVASMSVLAFTLIINKTIASWTGVGGVSLLEYAERLYMIPLTLLSSGILVTTLSHWSSRYQQSRDEGLRRDVHKTLKALTIFGIFLSGLLYISEDYIVWFAYGRGGLPSDKLMEIKIVFEIYILSITPYFLTQVYTRAFMTIQKTKILMNTAFILFLVLICLNFVFVPVLGVRGIVISYLIALLFALFFLSYSFNRWKYEKL